MSEQTHTTSSSGSAAAPARKPPREATQAPVSSVLEDDDPGPISDGAEVAAQPTTRVVDETIERETFIPVSRFALVERLCDPKTWPNGGIAAFRDFLECLSAVRNLTYTKHLTNLKEAYLPFSPDRDTVRAQELSPQQLRERQERLTGLLSTVLECANYKLITTGMLEDIFEEQSAYGLDLEVDLNEFDEVMIYSRGSTVKAQHYRSWRTLFLKRQTRNIPIFQRLFLLLKLKDEEERVREIMIEEDLPEEKARKKLQRLRRMLPDQASPEFIYLKMFKQIPRADLQMMFPNTRVQFRLRDKLFLGVTAGGGTLASIVSAAGKIALVVSNPIKALGALVGLAAVVFRQIKKFFNQKNQYMMTLAQNLYFHNLADNRGVLTLLTDRAEEEDIKEEMLLYALLARGPLTRAELVEARDAIELFLWDEFSVAVRFDIFDALQRLLKEGIVSEGTDGVLRAMSPEEGAAHLRNTWQSYLAQKQPDGETAMGDADAVAA